MNGLSWFLYLVDVLTSLNVFLVMVAIAGPAALAAAVIVCKMNEDLSYGEGEKLWAARKAAAGQHFRRYAWAIALFAGLAASLIPSKDTMYAIAASEMGERVVKNERVGEIANDATRALHQWIKKQIEPETKK